MNQYGLKWILNISHQAVYTCTILQLLEHQNQTFIPRFKFTNFAETKNFIVGLNTSNRNIIILSESEIHLPFHYYLFYAMVRE